MTSAMPEKEIVAEYSARLSSHKLKQSAYERRHKQLGFLKLALAAFTVVVFVLALKSNIASAFWLLLPLAALAYLEKIHTRVFAAPPQSNRSISFSDPAIAHPHNPPTRVPEPAPHL